MCVSRYYKGNDWAGSNRKDIILVIGDISDIPSDFCFKGRGAVHG